MGGDRGIEEEKDYEIPGLIRAFIFFSEIEIKAILFLSTVEAFV